MFYQAVVLPPSDEYPLYITAKRYWSPLSNSDTVAAALADDTHAHRGKAPIITPSTPSTTLICLHSTSFHKETWEPFIADLFKAAHAAESRALIQDVWSIECPNHGESAILNLRLVQNPNIAPLSCNGYARAVQRFLTAPPELVGGVDFGERDLVGVGHSLGANAMIMLQSLRPRLAFSGLILVEPMVSALGSQQLDDLRGRLVQSATKRRDTWPSREVAFDVLNKRLKWDSRVLKAYVRYGIRWDDSCGSYSLNCTSKQEVDMYQDIPGATEPVTVLDKILPSMTVHLVLGEIGDFIPTYVQAALVDPTSERVYASVTKVSNVGHLIPQETPTRLANLVHEILLGKIPPRTSRL